MAPLHVATLTVQRELHKYELGIEAMALQEKEKEILSLANSFQ